MPSLAHLRLLLAVAAAAALVSCRRSPEAPGRGVEVRYDGATSISAKVLPALARALRQGGVELRVDRSGSGAGLERLFAGEVDVAGVSRGLDADELARRPYFQIIGYDALAVWVNDANPVRGLSSAQLRAIFGGPAASWRGFGGKDVPIVPCTEHVGSERATVETFRTMVLEGGEYGRVKELDDPSDCVAFVSTDPRGVAAATVTFAAPGVHPISVDGLSPSPANVRSSRYLLTRPLLLVSREPPKPGTPAAALFEAALSPEGQAAITAAGFVPAR